MNTYEVHACCSRALTALVLGESPRDEILAAMQGLIELHTAAEKARYEATTRVIAAEERAQAAELAAACALEDVASTRKALASSERRVRQIEAAQALERARIKKAQNDLDAFAEQIRLREKEWLLGLHEGEAREQGVRDGELSVRDRLRELYKEVNELREKVPAPDSTAVQLRRIA